MEKSRVGHDQRLILWRNSFPAFAGSMSADAKVLDGYTRVGAGLIDDVVKQGPVARLSEVVDDLVRLRKDFLQVHARELFSSGWQAAGHQPSMSGLVGATFQVCPELLAETVASSFDRCSARAGRWRSLTEALVLDAFLRCEGIADSFMALCRSPSSKAELLVKVFADNKKVVMKKVEIERKGGVAHITLTGTNNLNAEDNEVVDELETAVDLALLDPEVKCCVLRGGCMTHPRYRGRRVLSSGLNLKELRDGRVSFLDFFMRRELCVIAKIVHGLHISRTEKLGNSGTATAVIGKPWIGVIDAFAIGGGLQLMLACDFVVAESESYVVLPAAKEGLIPGFAALRLSKRIGAGLSRELLLLGARLLVTDVRARGLFHAVTSSEEETSDVVSELVRQLSAPPIAVNRHMLNVVEEPAQLVRIFASEFALLQARRLDDDAVSASTSRAFKD